METGPGRDGTLGRDLAQLAESDSAAWAALAQHGFDARAFAELARSVAQGTEANRVTGLVTALGEGELAHLPARASLEGRRLVALGEAAVRRGEIALAVLAGGMATRMGGVVKALMPVCGQETFLDLRLADVAQAGRDAEAPPPLWLMSSQATDAPLRAALVERGVDTARVGVFRQRLFPRLTPEGRLFRGDLGEVSLYAPGHGDLPDALRESGFLGRFIEQGGRSVMVANIDNLGASLDPLVIGWHLASGAAVTCEVVDKLAEDRGGIPVRLDERPVVLEEFRLPRGFDPQKVRVFNTNTFHFDAKALLALDMEWTHFAVEKEVGGKPVLQLERLLGEVTSALETRFLRVPRIGLEARFLPVKDLEELNARRSEIRDVLAARGILSR